MNGDLARLREQIIGHDAVLDGPFGPRRITYADYTASGRCLESVERFIRGRVLPYYANTHTESSGTGRQTTRLREAARAAILAAVGGSDDDAVIFCGAGATAAIDKTIDILNLRIPDDLDRRYRLAEKIPAGERPVVFIGPYEHHSNEISWRETIADVVVIDEDARGGVDLDRLERRLREYAGRPLRIGSFSAASNVTGIITDIDAVTRLLHAHGALAFWDYAAAGPYLPIRMSAAERARSLDAVFLSPHKFVGGPGAPGVLVIKRTLLANRVPTVPGGGTVAYVSERKHDYLADPVHREEGGTPDIIGAIRAGLAFQIKQAVGDEALHEREVELTRRAFAAWTGNPNVHILGNAQAARLPIFSMTLRYGAGFLHHDFVVTLLNDVFGIQTRGGCSCAGPYGHRLLGIDPELSQQFESAILDGYEGAKPGWVRVSFHFLMSDAEVDYILRAVCWVAEHGWRLLPQYRFDAATGRWAHRSTPPAAAPRAQDLGTGELLGGSADRAAPRRLPESALDQHFAEAEALCAQRPARNESPPPAAKLPFDELRWFWLPDDALDGDGTVLSPPTCPPAAARVRPATRGA
jgi:selenocysteine lyase/cysteine desulfurase